MVNPKIESVGSCALSRLAWGSKEPEVICPVVERKVVLESIMDVIMHVVSSSAALFVL